MTQVHDAYYISTYIIWLVEKINSKKVKPFFFFFSFLEEEKVKPFKGENIYLTTSSSLLSTKDDYLLTAISSSLVVSSVKTTHAALARSLHKYKMEREE